MHSTPDIQHRQFMDAAKYAATKRSRNGAMLRIKALQLADRTEMLAPSAASASRRFTDGSLRRSAASASARSNSSF